MVFVICFVVIYIFLLMKFPMGTFIASAPFLIAIAVWLPRYLRYKSEKLGKKILGASHNGGRLVLYEKGVYISKGFGSEKAEIYYSDIIKLETPYFFFTEKKEKSVIGRAIVGNLLFGQTGAIVGAMSAFKESSSDTYSDQIRIHTKNDVIVVSSDTLGSFKKATAILRKKVGVNS